MFQELRSAIATARKAVGSLDPAALDGADAAELVELFTEIERLAVAGRTLAARRVAETNLWQREGHRTPAQWVAAVTSIPVGQAIGMLETAARLDAVPAVREAFIAGELSEAQTREIASAGVASPGSEVALLEAARVEPLAALRKRCLAVRAASYPDEASRYAAIHRRRFLRYWIDAEGAVRVNARLAPDTGAAVVSTIGTRSEQIFVEARAAGLSDRLEACAADALVELASGVRGPRGIVNVVVDQAALERGHVSAGERCEIPGVGPIPVATARAIAADSVVKVVVRDGADITRVSHLGRAIHERVRTALEVRDPVCVVPGCEVSRGLQIDHWRVRHGIGGRTELANLARLCRWHHHQKTYLGYRLEGGPGAWRWISPDEAEGAPDADARPPPDG